MPATMDPFLRAYTGADSSSVSNSFNLPKKRNPLGAVEAMLNAVIYTSSMKRQLRMRDSTVTANEFDDASVSSGRKSSLSDRKSSCKNHVRFELPGSVVRSFPICGKHCQLCQLSHSNILTELGSDSLWGDARRLSEAGVRRTSDSSVVLTEDTDSFIIGDKIWVGGTKPGTIAYIGDTQFAPGDWAGVVLDQPIGKNDGSVANIRYFQCEPKRGVFSRLTRLTRLPLVAGGSGDNLSMSFAGSGITSYSHIAPTTPPSTITRPSSAASVHGTGSNLKVGDRVIVMSSTGSRAGMLRYIGETEFSKGVWCGVECDDPVGKNDGSVQGMRYFTCQPMYGLFAPVAKVSLSPSPNRRPSCVVHPPGLVRQNTKDSITSVASTASRKSSLQQRKPSRPETPRKSSTTNSSEVYHPVVVKYYYPDWEMDFY